MALEGLAQPVNVYFDEWGIPTIEGVSQADVMRAQGFVHASDRLWQLELYQRVAQGRLAEVFGAELVDTDALLRTLGLWTSAGREVEALSPASHALLEAYAAGVNERLRTWQGPWPPEFLLLGIEPQPWTPQASVAIGRIMALDLSDWESELDRATALAQLPENRRPSLENRYPAWGPTILQDDPAPPLGAATVGSPQRVATPQQFVAPSPKLDPSGFLDGLGLARSNSWVLAGSRVADGHPIVANDMHLSLRAPSTWYANVLLAPEDGFEVAGLSIPGTPGVTAGFNRHLSWAYTYAMVDDADFVVEGLSLDRAMYMDHDGWQPFHIRNEEIEVRGQDEPTRIAVRSTVRGPVITDVREAPGYILSLLWTGRETEGPIEGLLQANRAVTPADLAQAFSTGKTLHLNVVYGSTDGSIGYFLWGRVLARPAEAGTYPIPFDQLPDDWGRFLPADSLPALRDPPSGYVVTANNLQSRMPSGALGTNYPAPFRARRIDDVISEARGYTIADVFELQRDGYSLWAEQYRPRAVAAARRAGLDSLAAVLEAWDLETDVHSLGPAPFYTWLYRLRELIAADEYNSDTVWFPDLAFMNILENPEDPWIDNIHTPEVERLSHLEEEAARTSARVAGVRWGDVHFEQSPHPLGQVPILDKLFRFNVGPYPVRGGRHTVRPDDRDTRSALDSTSWELPLVGEFGPSQRFAVYLQPDGPVGFLLLPTGQSGNPLDQHYRDMARVWANGDPIAVSLESPRDEIRSILRLHPR